ncbi:MAG: tetratricopeptide repeat protein [Planctomycetes bacterium]|nr:tetratricopeptide repeat protein [Planctomycetota bacterium]
MKGQRRHELKEDEFTIAVTQGVDWLKENHKPVVIGVTLVVVVGLFVGWYVVKVRNANNDAWFRLSQANQDLSMLRMSMFRRKPDKKMLKEARAELIEKYRKIARDFSGTKAAVLASLQAGNLLFECRNYTDAIAQFKAVREKTSDALLVQLATRSLGYALEEKGQWDEAAKEFARAAELGGNTMAAESKLDEGRCLRRGGDAAGAREALKKAVSLAGESKAAVEAEQELARMEGPQPLPKSTEPDKPDEGPKKPAVQEKSATK